ncbi:hypothetical protein BIW11_10751, partial [Tropilaelaps mercedesae]
CAYACGGSVLLLLAYLSLIVLALTVFVAVLVSNFNSLLFLNALHFNAVQQMDGLI